MTNSEILSAKNFFSKREYSKALKIFIEEKEYYSAGLCCLLMKDETGARDWWSYDKKSPASAWGLCVLDYINLKTDKIPTFFQTRAQLEIYISLLIENGLIEWAENLVSCCDTLFRANPESYKFIARALYANGYFELAITFCKKSLDVFYSDPEAFLIKSQCEFLLGNLSDALYSINQTLNIANNYYPALLFRKMLLEEAAKKQS